MSLLAVDDLSKAFGGVVAARDVSFTVERGEMLALIGPNGAGKSTVFNMIGGQLPPDRGAVLARRRGDHHGLAAGAVSPRDRPHIPGRAGLSFHDACARTSRWR